VKLVYVPSNIDGAGMYRCLIPARELNARGHRAVMAPHRLLAHPDSPRHVTVQFVAQDSAGNEVGLQQVLPAMDADVYVFQQLQEPVGLLLAEMLRSNGKRVVSETDDDFMNIPEYNPAYSGSDPMLSPGRNRYWLHKIFQASDALTVATPALAEVYDGICQNVRMIRNYLDWRMWRDAPQQSEVERRRVRVGWMGDLGWRKGDLSVLRHVLRPWLEKHPGVEFVAAGDPRTLDLLDIPKRQRVATGPVDFRNGDLADITAVMDIGLVPMELNRFNEAKSHLKGMEYAACGIPCIATPTESYADYWLADGEGGLLARKPKDWTDALSLLVGDDGLRREMGRKARAKAEQHTIQQHIGEWEGFYREVAGERVAEIRRSVVDSAVADRRDPVAA
jgi:glycosyl transferase family 1